MMTENQRHQMLVAIERMTKELKAMQNLLQVKSCRNCKYSVHVDDRITCKMLDIEFKESNEDLAEKCKHYEQV